MDKIEVYVKSAKGYFYGVVNGIELGPYSSKKEALAAAYAEKKRLMCKQKNDTPPPPPHPYPTTYTR